MTAPLRERLEAAKEYIRTHMGDPTERGKHIATLTEALAALAEREKDAERLDWCEENADRVEQLSIDLDGRWHLYKYGAEVTTGYPTFRDAIDAAIKEGK